jgi:hypothetical protein
MPLLSSTLVVAAGLSLASASPLVLAAPPVSVVACDYSSVQSNSITAPEISPFQVGNLRISFVNQAPLTATSIRFAVRFADRTQIIEDTGTFSTGTPVTQDFAPSVSAPYGGGAAQCSVEAVTFSDGSTWQPA